jgi:hypothetical protein
MTLQDNQDGASPQAYTQYLVTSPNRDSTSRQMGKPPVVVCLGLTPQEGQNQPRPGPLPAFPITKSQPPASQCCATWQIKRRQYLNGRPQWPRRLRRRSAAVRLLGSWLRIPPGAWMFVSRTVLVLSRRGLCEGPIPRPEESYGLWCVSECDQVKIKNPDTCCEQVEEGRTANGRST